MNENIFRKKSIDKVKSPENLDDYIQVSNPGVWLLLVSVIVLLAGVCAWGAFGHIDSVVEVIVQVKDGAAVCYQIPTESISKIPSGAVVEFSDAEAEITEIVNGGELGWYSVLQWSEPVADGIYDGKIVTESINPLSFILN